MHTTTAEITYPDGLQRRMTLGAGGLRIGRAPDNDLVIAAPGVAPYHAVIRCCGQNRTRLDSELTGRRAYPLLIEVPVGGDAGAAVRLGGYTIRVRR